MTSEQKILPFAFTQSTFSFEDIRIIIEQIESPIAVVDMSDQLIVYANDHFLELIQHQINDVIGSKIDNWIIGIDFSTITEGKNYLGKVVRKIDKSLESKISIHYFGKKSKFFNILVKPQISKEDNFLFIETRLNKFQKEIFSSITQINQNELINRILACMKDIFNPDILDAYLLIDNDDQYYYSLYQSQILPTKIFHTEIERIENIDYWQPGRRVLLEIHRAARIKNLISFFSFPLRTNEKVLALFVLGFKHTVDEKTIRAKIKDLIEWADDVVKIFLLISAYQKESNLITSNLKIQETIHQMISDAYLIIDKRNRILDYNDQLLRMTNYTPIEIFDQGIEIIFQNRADLSEVNDSYTQNGHKNYIYDKKGKKIAVSLKVAELENNNELKKIILIKDINKDIEIQEKLSEIENKASLGAMVADFAHEVRNPINNLTTGLQLLSLKIPDDESLKDNISRMQDDCVRINNLMESILSYSRQSNVEFKEVNINNLLNRVIGKLQNKSKAIGVSIKIINELNDENNVIMGDQRSLEQVFINIISNAIEAITTTGDIAVAISAAQELPQYLVVRIADTGPGIPSGLKEKIFQPFFSDKPTGTGLGLSIVSKIIEDHKGKIEIETFPGGTIFSIYLPLIQTGDQL